MEGGRRESSQEVHCVSMTTGGHLTWVSFAVPGGWPWSPWTHLEELQAPGEGRAQAPSERAGLLGAEPRRLKGLKAGERLRVYLKDPKGRASSNPLFPLPGPHAGQLLLATWRCSPVPAAQDTVAASSRGSLGSSGQGLVNLMPTLLSSQAQSGANTTSSHNPRGRHSQRVRVKGPTKGGRGERAGQQVLGRERLGCYKRVLVFLDVGAQEPGPPPPHMAAEGEGRGEVPLRLGWGGVRAGLPGDAAPGREPRGNRDQHGPPTLGDSSGLHPRSSIYANRC